MLIEKMPQSIMKVKYIEVSITPLTIILPNFIETI